MALPFAGGGASIYRLWPDSLPDEGFVGVEIGFDPTRYDTLWVCLAPAGSVHVAPSASDILWQTGS